MNELFRIETDRVVLSWSRRGKDPAVFKPCSSLVSGRLVLRRRRVDATFQAVSRLGPDGAVVSGAELNTGPYLYEQTDYSLFVRSKGGQVVRLVHRDPNIVADIGAQDGGRVLLGVVNFGSQVGTSEFTVLVDGQPEFAFEVDVFPTKLDYKSDYESILADVQETLIGLALEYLRATFKLGESNPGAPQPSNLEWIHLLNHVVDDLDRSLQYIARRPIRGTAREKVESRCEKLRRVDSSVRSAILRGKGSGSLIALDEGLSIRQRLPENRAASTLNTLEHRWLVSQLQGIRRRVATLYRSEAGRERSPRREQTLQELADLEKRITRLAALEPFQASSGDLPNGFVSLQLLTAPGYKEAYQCCMVLSLGLRIKDGPLHLTVKDLSTLYEYWCYLALLRLLSEETGQPIPLEHLFSVSQEGLQVLLKRGRENRARFVAPNGSEMEVTYNPTFRGDFILVPQKPDMILALKEPDWPRMHLVMDAKYRVDASEEYVSKYRVPGPPEDALNLLHRYRDAIIEAESSQAALSQPKRTVVQAAVVYPYETQVDFDQSPLWQSLHRLGIGAIPLLPGETIYLRQWIRSALQSGAWSLADKVIPHRLEERAQDWRVAAADMVLVGVLRPDDPGAHLEWIMKERTYYAPLHKTQGRQLAASWVCLYQPGSGRSGGSVTHWAPVEGIEIVKRQAIATPWPSLTHSADQLMVLYRLAEVRPLPRPIRNLDRSGRGSRFSTNRWTSRLAVLRARTVGELLLETEPEWRLYEQLRASQVDFSVEAKPPKLLDPSHPRGRAEFVVADGVTACYVGESGFRCRLREDRELYLNRVADVVEALIARD